MLISTIKVLGGGIYITNAIGLCPPSLPLADPSNMIPVVNSHFHSYVAVATFAAVIYDWALTFGREVELVWKRRWSLLTALYLTARYAGIPYAAMYMLGSLPSVSLTDLGCNTMFVALNWINVMVTAMLGVIMITRLHAMYRGSRKMLIFLIVILLVFTIACGAITATIISRPSKEVVVSGIYQCTYDYEGDARLLMPITWILRIVWEVLVLCLAVWIVVKHFRELRRSLPAQNRIIMILIKTHVAYFASFVVGSCIALSYFFPSASDSNSMGYNGVLNIFSVMQMFVLGPRLILNVREYFANLVTESNPTRAGITPTDLQEPLSLTGTGNVSSNRATQQGVRECFNVV